MQQKCYMFWYSFSPNEKITYINIIAYTYKQARFFFWRYLDEVVGHCYDYDLTPSYILYECNFVKKHNVGDILGENAII